jgi:hypothetical protein
MYVG